MRGGARGVGVGGAGRGGGCGLFLASQSPRDLHSDVFLSGQGGFCLILSDVRTRRLHAAPFNISLFFLLLLFFYESACCWRQSGQETAGEFFFIPDHTG